LKKVSDQLVDKTRSGREKPWAVHKDFSKRISDSLFRIGKGSIADKMASCGDFLKFEGCPDGHERSLKWASFCKARFCPMCQWRRSLKTFGQVFEVASLANQAHKIKWVFLTLTVQNVEGEKLGETITKMLEGFNRLVRREPLKSFSYGWFRSLEVTRSNKLYVENEDGEFVENEWYGTYHPHYHVLIAMKSTYMTKGYKTIDEWRGIWKECIKTEYLPVVHITTVKDRKSKKRFEDNVVDFGYKVRPDHEEDDLMIGAVAESAKYAVKSKDLFYDVNPIVDELIELSNDETDDILLDLYSSLNRRKMAQFGGLLLELKGDRDEAYDELILLKKEKHDGKCSCSVCSKEFVEQLYSWLPNMKNYYRIVKASQEEKIEKKIDHMVNGEVKIIKRAPKDGATIKQILTYGRIDDECE